MGFPGQKGHHVDDLLKVPRKAITEALHKRRMTQKQLADRLDIAPEYLNHLIKGKVKRSRMVAPICKELGISAKPKKTKRKTNGTNGHTTQVDVAIISVLSAAGYRVTIEPGGRLICDPVK